MFDDVTVNGVVTNTWHLESQGIICIHIPPYDCPLAAENEPQESEDK